MSLTAAMLLILAIGNIMGGNFDQIFNTINPALINQGEIISTYVVRTMRDMMPNYGLITAVGMFNEIINATLLLGANYVVKRTQGKALFSLGG